MGTELGLRMNGRGKEPSRMPRKSQRLTLRLNKLCHSLCAQPPRLPYLVVSPDGPSMAKTWPEPLAYDFECPTVRITSEREPSKPIPPQFAS